jgi:hypothetical protein
MSRTRGRRKLLITWANAAILFSYCSAPSHPHLKAPPLGWNSFMTMGSGELWKLVESQGPILCPCGHKRTEFPYGLKTGFLTNESFRRYGAARPTQNLGLPLVRSLQGHKEICWSDWYMLCNGIFKARTSIPVGLTTGLISVTFLIFTDTAVKIMDSKIASVFFLQTIYKLHLMF